MSRIEQYAAVASAKLEETARETMPSTDAITDSDDEQGRDEGAGRAQE